MSFFARNIDAIEVAAKIMFWGSLAIAFLLFFEGRTGLFMAIVLAVTFVSVFMLNTVASTWAYQDDPTAVEAELRLERLWADRERELHRGNHLPR
ncbi:hypothetical protein ACQPYK_33660 [Streptosporangium sp. CA-135522]|uniref:hypothetical protein n=1 Tax=Streptosporangium sp. CA-135522 TaxID=3240072 RepID=UPI003D8F5056